MPTLDSPHVVNIEDLRRLAQRRLPRAVFDYMDGGAADEVTLRENCRAFQEVLLRPRQAVANEKCDLHGSASRAGGARIRVWSGRRWASRSEASARDIAHGNGANDEVAGLRVGGRTEFVAARSAGRPAGKRARLSCRAYRAVSNAVNRRTRSGAHKIVFKQRFRAIRYFRF
jgi:hypothetical protein